MKIYKTSYFREIKEVECESITDEKVYFKLNVYNPTFKSDRIIEKPRYGSQKSYHETMLDAKNYVLMQLSDKITQMESDLKKYKNIVQKFR